MSDTARRRWAPDDSDSPGSETLVGELLERCSFPDPRLGPVTCAVSGGADSLALLVLARAHGLSVTAVHVDHGLRPGSADEADLVAAAAERFGAGFRAEKVDVGPGPNLEARARSARYAVLPDDSLLGHTADDQAETVVLALLRGSAWHGLSGMRPSDRRPIMALRRRETEALCRVLGLRPVDDESNRDPTHVRNRVRHEVLPLLNEIAGRDLVPVLVREADLIRDGADLLVTLAAEIDATDADAMSSAPLVLARQAARDWIWESTGQDHPPDLATVDRVLAVARLEVRATDVGRGWRVIRSRRRLRIEPPA